jgi:hypothetical protein
MRGLYEIVLAAASLPVGLWLYFRRTRPALAYAGARPAAFAIAAIALVLGVVGGAVRLVDLLIEFPIEIDRLLTPSGVAMAGGILALIAAGSAPKLVARLSGGPDPSVAPRYLANYYARWWGRDGYSPERAVGVVKWLTKHLEELEPPVDRALVSELVSELAAYRAAAGLGSASGAAAREHLKLRLASVRPVDPFGARW